VDDGGIESELRQQAEAFAARLTTTVRTVAGGDTAPFVLRGTDDVGPQVRLTIRQDPSLGIVLRVQGRPLLLLRVDYRCVWDHAQRFLAVDRSGIAVFATGVNEPLLRYEYVRACPSDLPGAHIQVHAHRDALAYVMTMCGDKSGRARRRGKELARGVPPRLSDLHLPVGGARFRPCLEDVLEMLINEMGVDAPPRAQAALRAGREEWRRDQLRAAVRDSPEVVAQVLEDQFGYAITRPAAGSPPDRLERLQAI